MVRGFGGDGPTITTTETQKKANLSARSRAVTVALGAAAVSELRWIGCQLPSPAWRIGDPWSTRARHVSYDLEGRLPGIHRIDSDPKFFFFVRKGITSRGLDGYRNDCCRLSSKLSGRARSVFINRPHPALSLSDAAGCGK